MREIKKPLVWVGSSKRDLKAFPRAVQRDLGQALEIAQFGRTPVHAEPLKGFKGAGVLELVEDHDGNTYRAVYTVRRRAGSTCCTPSRRSRRRGSRHRST